VSVIVRFGICEGAMQDEADWNAFLKHLKGCGGSRLSALSRSCAACDLRRRRSVAPYRWHRLVEQTFV